jgi:hypothetical protein
MPKCGVYNVLGVLADWGAAKLLLGHDEALRRNVWIHVVPPGTPPVSTRRRDVSRAGRLRWLNGVRSDAEAWDAYEAIDGVALLAVARAPQPWSRVRLWLLDLAEELDHAAGDGPIDPMLNLDRIWITTAGHAVLLEFPCPGAARVPPRLCGAGEAASIQVFLYEVAMTTWPEDRPAALPLHAMTFLTSLRNKTFEAPKVIIGNLKSLATRLAGVSRRRRLATLTLVPFWIIVCGLIGAAYVNLMFHRFDRKWAGQYPDIRPARLALQAMDHEWQDESLRNPFEVHVAGHYRHVLTNQAFWNAPETAGLFDGNLRRKAMRALEKYPNPARDELAAADTYVRPAIDSLETFEKHQLLWFAIGFSWFLMLAVALADLIVSGAFRQTMLLRLFGLVVVTTKGESASRLRLFWRSIVSWLPLFAGAPFLIAFTFATTSEFQEYGYILLGILAFVVTLWTIGVIWTVLRPTRGPHDWLAGTLVTPR